MLHAMVMAGGGGTRFWPRSRTARPKQFLRMTGERTLLQLAFDRLEGCALPPERCWIITGKAYLDETRVQLPDLPSSHVVGEPVGRDTAPCVALGAALIARTDPEAVILVTPADHVIEPVQEFRRAVNVAAQMAEENPEALITFGIPPTYASVGYGYIHRGERLTTHQGIGVFRVAKFEEKPPLERAERFFASGEYFWNAGIFVWKARAILDAIKANRPTLYEAALRVADVWDTPGREEVLAKEYPTMDKISIDYAVLEKHPRVLAVQAPYRWDDVGSWLALERMQPQDTSGNTVQGTHVGLNTSGCVIVGQPDRLIATIGVKDLLIVQDGECVLVAHRSEEATVKEMVHELRKRGLERHL
ncbi:MAG: mannose-1-phosphate guanylyltransferase [Planctomycetia bacterium]|nr:mannose-1-phosphate guanylyltransferase [Planctomycetia bacterium]